jgi:phage shock protein A
MESFDPIRHELVAKRHQLEQDLKTAQDHVSAIEADLERVDEALGALSGEKKRSRRRGRSRQKPVPTVAEIQAHIEHVRQESPFADANALLESVRSLVRERGSSLSGFKALFAEALAGSPGQEAQAHAPSRSPHHGTHHGHGGHGHEPFSS